MRFLTAVVFVVLAACSLPRVESFGPIILDHELHSSIPVIDSLMAATGGSPETILFRRTPLTGPPNTTGFYDPTTRQMCVAPNSPNRRRTLLHEFGHLLQHDNQPLLFAWVDQEVGVGRMPAREDMERFADDFRDAFDALSHHLLPRKPGARFIAKMLVDQPPFAHQANRQL